jgi:putative membrane protein
MQDHSNDNKLSADNSIEQRFGKFIVIISILIPVVVGLLFSVKLKDFGYDVKPLSFLPPIYATINGITAVVLVLAVRAIKKGNRSLHERLMTLAISFSVIFLVMYVAYHMTADSTVFGDVNHNGILEISENVNLGLTRYLYLVLLISHIVLSIAVIPLVLVTYVRALAERFDRHKKLAKITFPIWLYIAITGVIVYLMIAPYYAE